MFASEAPAKKLAILEFVSEHILRKRMKAVLELLLRLTIRIELNEIPGWFIGTQRHQVQVVVTVDKVIKCFLGRCTTMVKVI